MEPLKYRYNEAYIQNMVEAFSTAMPGFPGDRFQSLVFDGSWDDRELKERMGHLTCCLHQVLPQDYPQALTILLKAAPKFSGFEAMYFPDFVMRYGMDHREMSLDALAELTRYSSSEFAIRPFIVAQPQETMARMLAWAKDENYHVRRLASEGCRPRLPWAMALPDFKKDPSPILPILELLRDDPEEYVRRSVANNLNDISKDHPQLLLDITSQWLDGNKQRGRLLKHACRTLLKAGDETAMSLFGFSKPEGVSVSQPQCKAAEISIGDKLTFAFEIHCSEEQTLRLEYAVNYVKSNGKNSRKVFKISEREYPKGVTQIQRNQAFKDLTTRKHYPGEHCLEILVNGDSLAQTTFTLTQRTTQTGKK